VGDQLFISFVKQNTFVNVNEEGTEAAAVTTVGIEVTSGPPTIRFDRPFVFVIRERLSGTILFMGKVAVPISGD
jgi:serpin B